MPGRRRFCRATTRVPAGWVRLRLLNGSNARNFELRFQDRRTFHVIASDGGFLSQPVPMSVLRISPAERFEILVDFSGGQPVVLETGPDRTMGLFGAISDGGPMSMFLSCVLRLALHPKQQGRYHLNSSNRRR
ncbi:hypothetical protein H8A97_20505 [Bradyrhizobium sp. Arg62]|uniref:hypothetical protein n=1 Tax=Bradyrhizobium brasilense TaxID=1419277 RepID=UPI003B967B23|nr:hypothetical protein [Bradyrhizobium brasilense]